MAVNCHYCLNVLRFATNRLLTFEIQRKTWSPQPGVSAADLAGAGFFLPIVSMRRKPDEVRCAFCGVGIGDWRKELDPFAVHAAFPYPCTFIQNSGFNGNVEFNDCYFVPVRPVRRLPYFKRLEGTKVLNEEPVPDHPRSVILKRFQSRDAIGVGPLGPFHVPQMDTSSDKIAKTVIHMRPTYKEYTKESRLATFPPNWCPRYCEVPAEKLAEAGFFIEDKDFLWYTRDLHPIYDVVACFCCGVEVFGWHKEDDPWQVHQLFQRECYFLAISSPQGKPETPSSSPQTAETDRKRSPPPSPPPSPDPPPPPPGDVAIREKGICNVCLVGRINILCKPCKHASFCSNCSKRLANCPICRKDIQSRSGFFLT